MARTSRWGAVLVWMALIFILSAQSQLPSPEERWLDFMFEKSAHALEFAILAVLLLRALALGHLSSWRVFVTAVLLSWLYALSDEFHQLFVPGRSADWLDVLFDWLGACVGGWFWLRRRGLDSGVEERGL